MMAQTITTSVYCPECCGGETCSFNLSNISTPTAIELLRSFGRTCGRSGLPPEVYENAIWPTLPCQETWRTSGLLGNDAYNSPAIGRYSRSRACLGFYYRIVNESIGQDGTILGEGSLGSGSPTKNKIESWLPYREDKINLFDGESCGLYIYIFEFMYWNSNCTSTVRGDGMVWEDQGGSQYDEENNICNYLREYNVDMYKISQSGAYTVWPPTEFFEEGWMSI